MGRPKLTLKRIPNERERNLAFMKRKKGLMKQVSEISSLCRVETCLIIYDGKGDAPPVTWPQDPTEVHSLIEKYEFAMNENPPKNFDLHDFYDKRKSVVESEISKVRKGTLKIQHPTWHPSLNRLGEEQLRNFIAILDTKIEACHQRIHMLKEKQQIEANLRFLQNMPHSQLILAHVKPLIDGPLLRLDKGSQSQMLDFSPNLMQLMAKNGGMVDITNQVDVSVDPTNQIGAFGNATNNLDVPVLMAKSNEMMDVTNQVDVPVDCTNQIGAFGNSTYQLDVADWASQLGEVVDWAGQLGEEQDWASQPGDDVDWASQPDECINWASQVGVPVTGTNHISSATALNGASNYGTNFHVQKDGNEDKPDSSLCNYNGGGQSTQLCNFDPAMQSTASQFENVQQGAALHTLPPLLVEFDTDDYNNIFQDQLFNHIN